MKTIVHLTSSRLFGGPERQMLGLAVGGRRDDFTVVNDGFEKRGRRFERCVAQLERAAHQWEQPAHVFGRQRSEDVDGVQDTDGCPETDGDGQRRIEPKVDGGRMAGHRAERRE